jgi:hypothetical protein
MRARQIKPGFYKNEILASTSPYARLLFAGLWMLADRAGRLEDRPLRIRGELFPYEVIDVDALLCELSNAGPPNGQPELIFRYQFEDANYIQIVNFEKHQNPHVKEAPSTIPAPESPGASMVRAGERHIRATLTPSSLTPDSPLLKKDSCPPAVDDQGFKQFWDAYPKTKKKKKQDALKAWKSTKKIRPSLEILLESVHRHCKTFDWEKEGGQYIPLPATYLRSGCWDDDLAVFTGRSSDPVCTKCLVHPPSVDPPSQFCPGCLEGILADADREGVRVE